MLLIIRHPAVINSKALNIACVDIWKNVSIGILKLIDRVINPSCLSVDKAMIFFISFSYIALILIVRAVNRPIIVSVVCTVVEDEII